MNSSIAEAILLYLPGSLRSLELDGRTGTLSLTVMSGWSIGYDSTIEGVCSVLFELCRDVNEHVQTSTLLTMSSQSAVASSIARLREEHTINDDPLPPSSTMLHNSSI